MQDLSANSLEPQGLQAGSALSLIFKPGQRPSAGDILRLMTLRMGSAAAGHRPGFIVSHRPRPATGWLELLAGGFTFDLSGLAATAPEPSPAMAYWYGFRGKPPAGPVEAITLRPGKYLRGVENSLPVIRAMAGLAAGLARLAHVQAVVWHPARSAMAPPAFVIAIGEWLQGGAFPALGLTALFRDATGAIRSDGLAFFTGQELTIEPFPGKTTAQDAKIAVRLINELVGIAAIQQRLDFIGPDGDHFSVEPSDNDRLLQVWRKS